MWLFFAPKIAVVELLPHSVRAAEVFATLKLFPADCSSLFLAAAQSKRAQAATQTIA
jgi:hypothetical protein